MVGVIKENQKSIEKLGEAVQEIKTQGKVNEALQQQQTQILSEIAQALKQLEKDTN